jgi:hypothetical protein
MQGAHRVAFALANGFLPRDPYYVLHRCNNRPCIRADHLYCGTAKDNTNDRLAAGTQLRGEAHGNAKLTERQAREVLWIARNSGLGSKLINFAAETRQS